MNVFLTGATGYIGSAVARQLIGAGHRVTGLARSDESARVLTAQGIHPVPGDLMNRGSILAAARGADAAVHAASPGDEHSATADDITVSAILDVFAETEKSFVYTSGIWILGATGTQVAGEDWPINPIPRVAWREEIERRVLHAAEHGMRTTVIRPGVVYGRGKGILGMVCPGLDGVVRFVGDGANHWPVVELEDLARFYLLALEKAPAGSLFLAVSENVVVKDVAEALRAGYGARATESIPLETARAQMGEFADALVLDQQAHSGRARRVLGWIPQAQPLLESLKTSPYAV